MLEASNMPLYLAAANKRIPEGLGRMVLSNLHLWATREVLLWQGKNIFVTQESSKAHNVK